MGYDIELERSRSKRRSMHHSKHRHVSQNKRNCWVFFKFAIPNFIDLTFSSLTMFMIEPLTLTKSSFRTLLIGVVISFFYDIVHLIMRTGFYWSFELFYQDTERGVRRFSLIWAYILLVVKLFQMFIMWKVSIDYDEIIRYKARHSKVIDFEGDSEDTEGWANDKRLENTVY